MRINLIPVEQRPLKHVSIRWEFSAVVFALLLVICITGFGYVQRTKVDTLYYEYGSLQENSMILAKQRATVNDIETELNHLRERLNYYENLVTPAENLMFFDSWPNQLWLESAIIVADNSFVTGYSFDNVIASDLLLNFREKGIEANITDIKSISEDKLYSFTLDLDRR